MSRCVNHPRCARSRLSLLPAAVLAAVLLSGCAEEEGGAHGMPPQVGVAPVLVKTVSHWDQFNGRIEATETVELRPRVTGYIERVAFREGQEVKKGDVLFNIDPRSYRAELQRAEAQLKRAQALARQSANEAQRAKVLVQSQAVSTEQYEQRRAADESAQADVRAAQAALATAQLKLQWTEVRAPIDGRTDRARVTAGNLVVAGDAASVLTTLVSQEQAYVYFDVDENAFLRYAQMARDGSRPDGSGGSLPVRIGLANEQGFPHAGTLDFASNQLNRSSGTLRLRAVLDNHERLFTPGLYARVQLLGSGEFEAMLVDDKAILTDQDRKYVYIVDEQGLAQRRDVQPGGSAEGLRIIDNGLQRGDRVIVSGMQKVFMPGMPVDAQAQADSADHAAN
ncbi:efflux transporter periplasmic adaptor subunit [Pseudomonas aeruginosa]|uniref:efflux RND transporter periplasmic adaptor subunit n=1 Tax=Pseudomonadaceae TaxID=135621 RepID=UPI000A0FE1DF|nr:MULTISPECIES: efflux RND transporter periplasmic adaptor subunit [Pseudomonadaceae]ORL54801.1 efflux transporter periplasmic adaptor subunit [Pseudomonas aeruginosa]